MEDRGTIRALEGEQEFGCFSVAGAGLESNDAGSDGPGAEEGEEDESHDELDLLAAEGKVPEFDEFGRRIRRIPPVQAMDPADAADLKEFLEEEERRRVQFGDPGEERVVDKTVGGGRRSQSREEWGSECGERGGRADTELSAEDGTTGGGARDEDSDDEFGAWDRDESNAIYAVSDEDEDGPPSLHTQYEVDYSAELPDTPPPSDPPSLSDCDNPHQTWEHDLPTPVKAKKIDANPLSLFASKTSGAKNSKNSRSKTQARPILRSPSLISRHPIAPRPASPDLITPTIPKGKKGLAKPKESKHTPMDPPHIGLQTPPRSASFSSIRDECSSGSTPDLLADPPPRTRPKPRPIGKRSVFPPSDVSSAPSPVREPTPPQSGSGKVSPDVSASPKKRRKRSPHGEVNAVGRTRAAHSPIVRRPRGAASMFH